MANKISGIDGRPVQVGGSASVSRSRDATSGDRKTTESSTAVSNIDVSDTARTLAALENHIAVVDKDDGGRILLGLIEEIHDILVKLHRLKAVASGNGLKVLFRAKLG